MEAGFLSEAHNLNIISQRMINEDSSKNGETVEYLNYIRYCDDTYSKRSKDKDFNKLRAEIVNAEMSELTIFYGKVAYQDEKTQR